MKNFYKIAMISCALAFTACDETSSSASDSCNVQDITAQLCTETPVEGTICDARDGKIYKVATFDTQTWMIENLDYYDPCVIKSETWCYDNNASNCAKHGRLYSWTAAMGIDSKFQKQYTTLSGTQRGICPEGFHIPSDAETNVLIANFEDPNSIAEFAFTFGGKKNFAGFADLDREAYFWTADEDHSEFGSERNALIWSYSETFGIGSGSIFKDSGLSIRCVKD